jgi:hypothetical protein
MARKFSRDKGRLSALDEMAVSRDGPVAAACPTIADRHFRFDGSLTELILKIRLRSTVSFLAMWLTTSNKPQADSVTLIWNARCNCESHDGVIGQPDSSPSLTVASA